MFSIWEHEHFLRPPHLVVIGAGITGSFAALHYKRRFPEHRVVVLERGTHPSGASVKNAGFACFGSPSEILADIDAEGADAALARVEERWQGLRALRAELGDAVIGFEATGGYELFAADDPLYNRVADRFDGLNASLRSIFGAAPYAWQDERIPALGLRTGHLAFTALEGPIDTGAMMRALQSRLAAEGVEVRYGHAVVSLEDHTDGVECRLAHGGSVRGEQVLIATNGYTRDLLPGVDVSPARGQVLLTDPVPGLRLKGTFHAEEGFYYFRDHQGRVLLGGGRNLDKAGETTTEDAVTPLIQERLERLLREVILPDRPFTIRCRWSGVMGFRDHGKSPLVERTGPRTVVAAGLSGMGVAIGIRVAHRAVGLLVG